jgi:hypothetical protein
MIPAMKPVDLNPSKSIQVHGLFLILMFACLLYTKCKMAFAFVVPEAMARLDSTFLSLFISVAIHTQISINNVKTTNTT